MGQRIEIDSTRVIDESLLISTNRSFTGTDGEGFGSSEDAASGTTFPAKLAADLFEADDAIRRVYVSQNVVVITREDGWTADATASASTVVGEFFLFYPAA